MGGGTITDSQAIAAYLGFAQATLTALSAKRSALPIPRRFARVAANVASLRARTSPGGVAEFGVYKGYSISRMARVSRKTKFVGFDSFRGFPEDGRVDWQQDFSVIDQPKVPFNVTLVPGWFDETVRPYFKANPAPLSMIHVDCDLYSSTKTVFDALGECGLLRPGLVVAFDELINYEGFLWNEMLAFHQMLERESLSAAPIYVAGKVRGVEETLALLEVAQHPTMRDDQDHRYFQQAVFVLRDTPLETQSAPPDLVQQFLDLTIARGSTNLFA